MITLSICWRKKSILLFSEQKRPKIDVFGKKKDIKNHNLSWSGFFGQGFFLSAWFLSVVLGYAMWKIPNSKISLENKKNGPKMPKFVFFKVNFVIFCTFLVEIVVFWSNFIWFCYFHGKKKKKCWKKCSWLVKTTLKSSFYVFQKQFTLRHWRYCFLTIFWHFSWWKHLVNA